MLTKASLLKTSNLIFDLGTFFSDPTDPSIIERLAAVALETFLYVMAPPSAMSRDFIRRYAPHRADVSMKQLGLDAEIIFINLETYCLDTPRVTAPHYILLGGLGQ